MNRLSFPQSGLSLDPRAHLTRNLLHVLLLLCLAACASLPPPQPASQLPGDYEYTKTFARWLIHSQMRKHEVTGLSIALVDDQQLVWSQGFGFADRENQVIASADTIYRVGSPSRLFTVLAILQLVEQGKLDLDQPIQLYLPEFSIGTRFSNANLITPRNLMSHHSGLPSDRLKGMWSSEPESIAAVLDHLREESMAYPSDYVLSDSNLAMSVLGVLIERLYRQPFTQVMQQVVLDPLQMNHSQFAADPNTIENMSKGYSKQTASDLAPVRDVPAFGLNASVNDMTKFLSMIFAQGKVRDRIYLTEASIIEMLTPQNVEINIDKGFNVGLGWYFSGLGVINLQNVGPVAHHGGGTPLFKSQIIALPKHKLGVVVLANSASARTVVNTVATQVIEKAVQAKLGYAVKPAHEPTSQGKIEASADKLDSVDLAAYEGQYATIIGGAKVKRKGSALVATASNQRFQLVPNEQGSLTFKYYWLGFLPVNITPPETLSLYLEQADGRELLYAKSKQQSHLVGAKIRQTPLYEEWIAHAGTYKVVNIGADQYYPQNIQLQLEDGFLHFSYTIPGVTANVVSRPIEPQSNSEAIILGIGQGMGETIHIADHAEQQRLVYSGYILEKVSD